MKNPRRSLYLVLIASVACLSGVSANPVKPTKLACILGVENSPLLQVPMTSIDEKLSQISEPAAIKDEELRPHRTSTKSDLSFVVVKETTEAKKHRSKKKKKVAKQSKKSKSFNYVINGSAVLSAYLQKASERVIEEKALLKLTLMIPSGLENQEGLKYLSKDLKQVHAQACFDIPRVKEELSFDIPIEEKGVLTHVKVMCNRVLEN